MSDAFIFEDEVLPEIEIREILGIDEILEETPSFVVFTENEITQLLYELLTTYKSASSFSTLLHSLLQQKAAEGHVLPSNIIPILKANLKDNAENQQEFLDRLTEIDKERSYKTQQSSLRQLYYPLEQVLPENTAGFLPTRRTIVGLNGDIKETSVVFPEDNIIQALDGAAYTIPSFTKSSYLSEKRVNKESRHILDVQPDQDLSTVKPSYEMVLNKLDTSGSLHDVMIHLERYGYDFYLLSRKELEDLVSVLAKQKSAKTEKEHETKPTKLQVWKLQNLDMPDAWNHILKTSFNKEKYQMMYEDLVRTTPGYNVLTTDIPLDIKEITEGLIGNRFSLEEVMAYLRAVRTKYILDSTFETVKRYQEIDMDIAKENVQRFIEDWKRVYSKYTDRVAETFLDIYQDISEIKIGNAMDTYEGGSETMFLEEATNGLTETEEYIIPDTDDNDINVDINAEPIPDEILQDMDAGTREVIIPVLQKAMQLEKASGLPFNMIDFVTYIRPRIARLSISDFLQQHVPDLSEDVRIQLSNASFETALRIASQIVPIPLSIRTKDAVKHVFDEYQKTVKAVLIELLAWWVLEVQEAALSKQLDFNPMNGMLSCILKWSFFGVPLNKEKEGVLPYLACCATEVQYIGDMIYEELFDRVQSVFNTMTQKVEQLKTKLGEYLKENTVTSSRAKAAEISFMEAYEKKMKNRIIPEFVKAYLNMPGLLANKQSQYAFGCCIQKLGPSFSADSDWRDYLKKMRDVKAAAFAKRRMVVNDHPVLGFYKKQPVHLEMLDGMQPSFVPPPALEETKTQTISTWLQSMKEKNLPLLPKDAIDMLEKDAKVSKDHVEKHIKAALKTAQKTYKLVDSILMMESYVEAKRILDTVTYILSKQKGLYKEDTKEFKHIQASLLGLVATKKELKSLHGVYDEIETTKLRYTLMYIISRALCLPANCDDIQNGRLILESTVNASFLSKTLKAILEGIHSLLTIGAMPSSEQQQAFITNMREAQKVETLSELDSMTLEERELHLEMKKLGLLSRPKRKIPESTEETTENTEESKDEDNEEEGKREFDKYAKEDNDDDDTD